MWHTQNSLWVVPVGTSKINSPSKTAETEKMQAIIEML